MDPSQASVLDGEYNEEVKPNVEEEATLVARRSSLISRRKVVRARRQVRVKIVYMGRGAFYVTLSWIAFQCRASGLSNHYGSPLHPQTHCRIV